ncbi:MAG: hydrogenase maturation protease [Rhodoblastus sp.]|nr:hydrogenase maturation protease [Rhodoblastus sp.]
MKRPIIIGLGNPNRGDDAVGRVVAQILKSHGVCSYDIEEAIGEATEILSLLEGREHVTLIDACVSGAPVGTIHQFDMAIDGAPNKGSALSSHGLGLAQAIGIGRALGLLPKHCVVFAIEAASFEHGSPLTPEVEEATVRLLARISAQLLG